MRLTDTMKRVIAGNDAIDAVDHLGMTQLINQGHRMVLVEELTPHPNNPNRGDMEAIRASIRANGFWGAVVARELPDGRLQTLAGWHRAQAAAAEGLLAVPVTLVRADDVTAVRILLADNETAHRSSYDQDTLDALLDSLEDLEGTGFEWDLEGLDPDPEPEPGEPDEPEAEFATQYGLVVTCTDEVDQQEWYETLVEMGATVRVVSI